MEMFGANIGDLLMWRDVSPRANLNIRNTRSRSKRWATHTATNSSVLTLKAGGVNTPLVPSPCRPYLEEDGFCPFCHRLISSGLKQFLGCWLCSDPGPFTWRPPVHTGPPEYTTKRLCGSRHFSNPRQPPCGPFPNIGPAPRPNLSGLRCETMYSHP
jgi:hypothetical protein